MKMSRLVLLLTLLSASFALAAESGETEIVPLRVEPAISVSDVDRAVLSERSLTLAISVDRSSARLVSYSVKPEAFLTALSPPASLIHQDPNTMQFEIVLLGDGTVRHTQHVDVDHLCMAHDGDAMSHVTGDLVVPHRDTILVAAPEVVGLDRVEIASYSNRDGTTVRRVLGSANLDAVKFSRAGGDLTYDDLVFARVEDLRASPDRSGASGQPGSRLGMTMSTESMTWPEDCSYVDDAPWVLLRGDPEPESRMSLLILGDGYQCNAVQGPQLLSDAQDLATYLGTHPPLNEYDDFINYYLVPAFSAHQGTDRCFAIPPQEANTAFGTYWKDRPATAYQPVAGVGEGGCDAEYEYNPQNLIDAKSRVPGYANDNLTIFMVNYSGSHYSYATGGGGRVVLSRQSTVDQFRIPLHEIGHMVLELGDEYGLDGNPCTVPPPDIDDAPNVSSNPVVGVWPEWVSDSIDGGTCTSGGCLGMAKENGHGYKGSCFYHPTNTCLMELYSDQSNEDLCPVCRQAAVKAFWGHPSIASSAPLKAAKMALWTDNDFENPLSSPVLFGLGEQPCVSFDVTLSPIAVSAGTPMTVERVLVAPDGTTYVREGLPDPDVDICIAEPGHFFWYYVVTAEPDLVKTEYPEYWEYSEPSNRDYAVWEICTGDPATDWCECLSLPTDRECPGNCTVDTESCEAEIDTHIQCGEWPSGGTFGCDQPGQEGMTVHHKLCDCTGESGGIATCSDYKDRSFWCDTEGGITPGQ